MQIVFNPLTGLFDLIGMTPAEAAAIPLTYLKLDCSNDPLTGGLKIIPYYAPSPAASDTYSAYCSKNIILKAGQKLIFDGEEP